ncbi:MAG: DNA photolyase family protein [Aquiluna sp.]|nr:DNA photolyase family protein [Aquiluna sp.]MCF8545030.1 DNA photolyase family protein [Aquiluna sp.]
MATLYWFRNDLRIQDNEALARVIDSGEAITPVFVLPEGFSELSEIRKNSLIASFIALQADFPTKISILHKHSDLLAVANQVSAGKVISMRAYDTTGKLLQAKIAQELFEAGIALELVGSNYAVTPGTVLKDDGSPLRVYTPFYKRWSQFDPGRPIQVSLQTARWIEYQSGFELPTATFEVRAGEKFALETFAKFRKRALSNYSDGRNRMDQSGTSHLSHALAHGEIHPRTLLVQLGDSPSEETFRKEICWREFYADVLFHNPHTLTEYYNEEFARMAYANPEKDQELLVAWQQGKTGYPVVDAAMRQLLTTGWMHNRARMVVASFLVKDLHFEWQIGASWFEEHLTDFDPASNAHGWQWTAGCGTDASPYYRVFNPILQGLKFDPNGDYVRKFVPELRHLVGASVHTPWEFIDGYSLGYPAQIVDHAKERDEALARLKALKGQ